MRYIESDEKQCMRGAELEEAIRSDKAKGLVPFWVRIFKLLTRKKIKVLRVVLQMLLFKIPQTVLTVHN